MRCRFIVLILVLLCFLPSVLGFGEVATEDPAEVTFQSAVLPFLAKNCLGCHGNGESKADLSLDKYKDDLSLIKDRKVWDNVVNMLEKREMPPKENPQPSAEDIERVVKAIDRILSNLDCGKPGSRPNAGRVTIRRLNRTEYNNTIRDLVGIDFRPADDFPADDVGYGFDNIGDVLSFSPLLAEKYLIAAETILEEAIVIMDPPKRTSSRVGQLRPTSATTMIEQSGFIAFEEGDYVIRAKVDADQSGDDVAKAKLRVSFQGTDEVIESEEFQIPGTKDNPTIAKHYGVPNIRGKEFVRVPAPPHSGGIMTQASVLTLTSNATRTSPVKRGKFVLEQILNTPPPPPPADVPACRNRQERSVSDANHRKLDFDRRNKMKKPLSRRTILRGLGASMALPMLDIMQPRSIAGVGLSAPPKRMAWVYIPQGAYMPNWMPTTEGENFELTPSLEPMVEHRKEMIVFGGLTCDKGRANGDGGGDHARAGGAFLTGAQPKKTAGVNF